MPRDHRFGSLEVSEPVSRALGDLGYIEPTEIQKKAIPVMLSGKDMVGQAQTGTGKTAGFGIPLAEVLDGRLNEIQAIILVPTRELAQQVSEELRRINKYNGVRVVAAYGGQPIAQQLAALQQGAHIIVGTPGRVMDHMDRRTIRLDRVKIAILDEADQMLDIGFLPDIRRILGATPRRRQTALFSATVPTQIRRLIYYYLQEPEWVRLGGEAEPVPEVRQTYYEVAERDKRAGLEEVLAGEEYDQALIFCRMQIGVDRLCSALQRKGYAVEGIHGSMPQRKRDSVMRAFRDGSLRVLVATNLASRGLDIPAVSNVINYDMPENVEEYVHRIGRTARMGREGTAVTFVAEWDLEFFQAIKEHVGEDKLERRELAMYNRST